MVVGVRDDGLHVWQSRPIGRLIVTAPVRVAMVTNIPAPYRLPVYEQLAASGVLDFCVFFFSGREPDRDWALQAGNFRQVFFQENFLSFRNRFIHFNPDLWQQLRRFRPEVIITTGFNPSHLIAFAYARIHRIRHVAMTDGTLNSEKKLSLLHRVVRRIVYRRSSAFIGASDGTNDLYRRYGIAPERIFKSHLCADNAAFALAPRVPKHFDFIFCGRFAAVKNPFFAIDVACAVSQRLGRKVTILFVGSGELLAEMQAAVLARAEWLDAAFAGFATQAELPALYGSAQLFLFPTQWDPWGVVANEACAAGLPVLISPVAGSAHELVVDGDNGYVLPLELDRWAEAAVELLSNPQRYATMSQRSLARVAAYTYQNAAKGIIDATAPPRQQVVIVQRRMTNYRIPLFDLMRPRLAVDGIDLRVVYGDPTLDEAEKNDGALLSWGEYARCVYWFGGRLCWQNVRQQVKNAKLVIVTQENKLLFNFVLGMTPGKHMAFWGHGRNFQAAQRNTWRERVKRWWMIRVDWWFAYTDVSARVIIDEAGFPAQNVTVLNNSIDTSALARDLLAVDPEQLQTARERFRIGAGPIGIMIASLHRDKQIDYLLDAAELVREKIPGFELVLVGDGQERESVRRRVARAGGWIHWVGARDGLDKAVLLKMSQVMLNPGMVGLGILDSFVAGVPMVTSSIGRHSPEIAYLKPGYNGLASRAEVADFAACVVAVLSDPALHEALRAGCLASAADVSIEKMVENFCDGIRGCLKIGAA